MIQELILIYCQAPIHWIIPCDSWIQTLQSESPWQKPWKVLHFRNGNLTSNFYFFRHFLFAFFFCFIVKVNLSVTMGSSTRQWRDAFIFIESCLPKNKQMSSSLFHFRFQRRKVTKSRAKEKAFRQSSTKFWAKLRNAPHNQPRLSAGTKVKFKSIVIGLLLCSQV